MLTDVQQRHDEILTLSQTIISLQRLFQDLSSIVQQQDELINSVAYQVGEAEQYMENANDTLGKAVKSARSARRKRWCLCIFCFILLALVGGLLALYFTGNLGAITNAVKPGGGSSNSNPNPNAVSPPPTQPSSDTGVFDPGVNPPTAPVDPASNGFV